MKRPFFCGVFPSLKVIPVLGSHKGLITGAATNQYSPPPPCDYVKMCYKKTLKTELTQDYVNNYLVHF